MTRISSNKKSKISGKDVRNRIDGGDSVYRIAETAADAGYRSVVGSGAFEVRNRGVKPKANQAA